MPKVKGLTQAQKETERRKAAVRNFHQQLTAAADVLGITARQVLGRATGTPRASTMSERYADPWRITKEQERGLMLLFAECGLTYDPTWGEGSTA